MKELFFESIDSTNTYLKKHYEELEDLCFVRTDLQTAGRGRNGRSWTAAKGENLLFSLLIKDEKLIDKFRSLSVISAYLVLKTLQDYGLNDLSIKWPNDVYVKDKKICGILLEAISREKMECLIIGIGLNVNQTVFEGDYLIEPTSMKKELDRKIDLLELKEKLFGYLTSELEDDHYEQIKKYDYLKGKTVQAQIRNELKTISVIGIDEDYSLRIIDDGKETKILSGEISFHERGGI
ncbi:MAG: biotin--[acetyl-CoA-carboxylase] ligase [Erysipelotrichaceae bacterium]|nr:biotin--[acetyl-CoA-carboxylase] ligase [Erysipelotrichaceae bacterium]